MNDRSIKVICCSILLSTTSVFIIGRRQFWASCVRQYSCGIIGNLDLWNQNQQNKKVTSIAEKPSITYSSSLIPGDCRVLPSWFQIWLLLLWASILHTLKHTQWHWFCGKKKLSLPRCFFALVEEFRHYEKSGLSDETFYKDLRALIDKGRKVGGKIRGSPLEMSFYILWIWPNEP